ncbi:MAG: hypothetical protein K0Q70_2522 [Rhodospirillales bacterium]|jgi:hypothetical protein|nr:hypothetical protein [Rhodospirillales bacterium]
MTDYRLFLKDIQGRISRRVDLDCPDDKKAIAHAQAFDTTHGADLWVDSHRVYEFPPLARKNAA